MTGEKYEWIDPAEVQASHWRTIRAKERGEEPAPEDKAITARVNASPYWWFDRPWRRDDDD